MGETTSAVLSPVWYKRKWVWAVGVVLLIAVAASAGKKKGGDGSGTTESKKAALVVAPATLLADYKANEVAADEKYKNKWLRLEGPVDKIAKDITDTIYVTFKSGERFEILSVQCFFDDKQKAKAAQISQGQTVAVIGKCNGKFGNVLIKSCEFAE